MEVSDGIPIDKLEEIEHNLNALSWTVHVHPASPMDVCLRAYQRLCIAGKTADPILRRFESGALPNAFEKLLLESSVNTWDNEILVALYICTL